MEYFSPIQLHKVEYSYSYLSYDVDVQWITSCHKYYMTTCVIALRHVHFYVIDNVRVRNAFSY